ncbi:hypothetical protein DPEC_G00261730 [Dallia pectoralis]|uniref:Uncharacterized protein n=1 Tax=Dallia pectoralis TaxID=75939 RepID=A0ACC2FRN3_DALPE|nr:hypothetical protein DPEC_G00261730 [Dallia pectoralis]
MGRNAACSRFIPIAICLPGFEVSATLLTRTISEQRVRSARHAASDESRETSIVPLPTNKRQLDSQYCCLFASGKRLAWQRTNSNELFTISERGEERGRERNMGYAFEGCPQGSEMRRFSKIF